MHVRLQSYNIEVWIPPKRAASASIVGTSYQHTYGDINDAVSLRKLYESTKDIDKANKEKPQSRDTKEAQGTRKPPIDKDLLDNQANEKVKEMVVRQ